MIWFMRLGVALQSIILHTIDAMIKFISQDLDCRYGWQYTIYVSATPLYQHQLERPRTTLYYNL